ncbi:MAG: L-histidine N(alpha)-methyltransferase [Gemmatimonas sp.]|nr:L-histidine N(alpha)-methyltransferase [Gemmatimonas sp.]
MTLYDYEPTPDRICDDVVRGLTRRPRTLPPKYFYDEKGARIFEQITELEAYYPTRTEISILRAHAAEMAERVGRNVRLVEFGSGSGDKTWLILEHLVAPAAYIPVDISRAQLVDFAIRVSEAFPNLRVEAVCADYTAEYELPDDVPASRSVAFFPGSTIGNFEPGEAETFLGRVRRLVGPNGGLLLGVDLRKDPGVIELAYNDPQGVTAEFNLNLLRRINRECYADFDLDGFRHNAFFDDEASRIEMRLVSERRQAVRVGGGPEDGAALEVEFHQGDHITTEYSHKYDLLRFAGMADAAGWRITDTWTDEREWFAVLLLE